MSEATAPVAIGRIDEWRNGWQLVMACFAGAILAGLALNTVGVFMGPLGDEFGWSKAQMSAAVPINGWPIALTAPFVGGLIDRVGARRVGLSGCVALPAAIACLGLMGPSIWTYWVGWSLIGVAQISANILIWTMPVAGRFVASRGTALAIVLMGNSAAGILYPPIGTLLIQNFGWRFAYVLTGAGLFALCIPLIWLFFYDRRDLVRRGMARRTGTTAIDSAPLARLTGLTARQAMRTRHFWQLLAAVFLGSGAAVTIFIHLIPIATSVGLSRIEAAAVASALGLATLAAKMIAGPLVDRLPAPPLAAVTMLCPVLSCLLFMGQHDLGLPWAILAGVLVGLGTGAELDMIGVLAARMFGVASYGRIYGMALTAFQVAVGAGPLIVGYAYDRTQNYDTALAGLIVCLVGSALLFGLLGRSDYERDPRPYAAPTVTPTLRS